MVRTRSVGSTTLVTCRSPQNRVERQLPELANSHSMPMLPDDDFMSKVSFIIIKLTGFLADFLAY